MTSLLFAWRHALSGPDGPRSSTTRHVALALSLHADSSGGSCFPSVRLLASETRLSGRAIVDHLRILEAEGWITRSQLKTGKGWRRSQYQLTIPIPWEPSQADAKVLNDDQQQDAPDVLSHVQHDSHGVEPPSNIVLNHVQLRTSERAFHRRGDELNEDARAHAREGGPRKCSGCGGGLHSEDPDYGKCFTCRSWAASRMSA